MKMNETSRVVGVNERDGAAIQYKGERETEGEKGKGNIRIDERKDKTKLHVNSLSILRYLINSN